VTTSIASEVSDRKSQQRITRDRLTFAGDLVEEINLELTLSTRVRFPSDLYRQRPVEYFRTVLGVEPWAKQVEIMEAVRDHPRVAVRSGHKVSKSHTAAGIALWYYCSFPDARVVMTSTTSRQVDQILWRELRMMRARGGRCVECKQADPDGFVITRPCEHSTLIEGEQGELARTGLKSRDFREIVGFTAREAEAVAGISGRNLLYLIDEASGVGDDIFEAIEGNRAGGARIVMFGNPTRNEGEFYEAFHGKASHYKTITVSSEETPNVVQGRVVIPGLATREWIDEKKEEWGEKSAMYCIRVRGTHALAEAGKIFSIHAITMAEQRWADTVEAGRLFIGIDPAGESGSGDESAFAARRGLKQLLLRAHQGLNEEAHLSQLLQYIALLKLPRETPVVVVDREGSIGSKLHILLRNYAEANPQAFEVVGVRASDKAMRRPLIYDRMRDELAANLEQWFRDGGAILEDVKLERELHAFEWKQAVSGRLKITPKDVIRKAIGRSPDRYDATALSCWEPLSLQDHIPSGAQQHAVQEHADAIPLMDPYAGANAWRS
jgi:phage terminase large subunit